METTHNIADSHMHRWRQHESDLQVIDMGAIKTKRAILHSRKPRANFQSQRPREIA